MTNMLTAEASVTINASPAAVWKALTDPAMIKEYMFGTETTSDWKVGSRITYRGIWQGKEYEDGGTILEIEPGKILKATYWSSMSGTEDKPENYSVVTYSLEKTDGSTKLTVTQDNCKTEESKQHSEGNWNMVLGILKKLLE